MIRQFFRASCPVQLALYILLYKILTYRLTTTTYFLFNHVPAYFAYFFSEIFFSFGFILWIVLFFLMDFFLKAWCIRSYHKVCSKAFCFSHFSWTIINRVFNPRVVMKLCLLLKLCLCYLKNDKPLLESWDIFISIWGMLRNQIMMRIILKN